MSEGKNRPPKWGQPVKHCNCYRPPWKSKKDSEAMEIRLKTNAGIEWGEVPGGSVVEMRKAGVTVFVAEGRDDKGRVMLFRLINGEPWARETDKLLSDDDARIVPGRFVEEGA